MKKLLAMSAALLAVAAFTMDSASARHHHYHRAHHGWVHFGGNAAMSGNNGNSAHGSNSLGHIKGGNLGAGK